MTGPYYTDDQVTLWHGDALNVLRTLPDESVGCCVTSPPYFGLRDYGEPGQYGLEATPAAYVETMRAVFAEVRRVLAKDGTLWLNLGDSYAGTGETGRKDAQRVGRDDLPQYGSLVQPERSARRLRVDYGLPAKNLLGIPWRVAFALQDDGWILRNAVVWHKPNAMPESVTDRLSSDYEHLFLFTRSPRYWFDLDAIREPLAYPEALDGTRVFGGKEKGGGAGRIGAAARRAGLHRSVYGATGMPEQTNMGPTGSRHVHASERGRNPGSVWTIPTQPFTGSLRTARPVPGHHAPDGRAYGKERIASTDCPQHGSSVLPDSTTSHGGHEGAYAIRTSDTGAHPGQAPADDSAPTETTRAQSTQPSSSGSTHRPYESAATTHNTGIHRTALDLSTSRPCTPSAQSPAHTERIEGLLDFDAPATSRHESSSDVPEGRAAPARTSPRTPDRCTCSWVDNTPSTSHFAVMPPELARRCILAGCRPGGSVLDPFAGSGTTGMVALKHGHRFVGIDLSATYLDLALRTRLAQGALIEPEDGAA